MENTNLYCSPSFVVDETPYKQGLFVPGTHIPIVPLQVMKEDMPGVAVILPWNWKNDIIKKLSFILSGGAKIVTFIPEMKEYDKPI